VQNVHKSKLMSSISGFYDLLDKISVTEYPLISNLPFTAPSTGENRRPAAHVPYYLNLA